MPDHDTISSERLDRRNSPGAEQTLQTRQLTLTFKHQSHHSAFDRWLAAPHAPDRSPWGAVAALKSKLMHYPSMGSASATASSPYCGETLHWNNASGDAPRMLKLNSKIQRAEVVHTGPELVAICACALHGSDAVLYAGARSAEAFRRT